MDDIKFPAWVKDSPALAMASVLSQLLIEESVDRTSGVTAAAEAGGNEKVTGNAVPGVSHVNETLSNSEESDGEAAVQQEKTSADGDEDDGGHNGLPKGVVDSGYLRMVDRLMDLNSKALDSLQPSSTAGSRTALVRTTIPTPATHSLVGTHASPLAASAGIAFGHRCSAYSFGSERSRNNNGNTAAGGTSSVDILHDARVRTLLRLSRLNDILTSSEATRHVISQRTAAAMISFFAFAVSCRGGGMPAVRTKGFFTECSSLYTTLFSKLRSLRFARGVSVEDFTASLVACGLKLRDDRDCEADESGGAGAAVNSEENMSVPMPHSARSAAGSLVPNTGGREKNLGLAGFSYRTLDATFVSNIPQEIDACVRDVVALGIIRGVALTYSQQLFYLGPDLVNHMHDLTDAFATSTHRRELSYKRVLSILLEAISCSRVIDYERTNNWITAIIQETYVVRGLFQREVLHAHVVSAALTLLIRQYQEMAKECAAKVVDLGTMPDFTEGDQLMELVWKALHDVIGSWEEAVATAEKHPLILFRHNIEIVVQHLLRTEVERLRCYYIITSATNAYQESLIAPLSQCASQQPWRTPESEDTPLAASTQSPSRPPPLAPVPGPVLSSNATPNKGTRAETAAAAARPTVSVYVPSEEEEALRILICSNIVKLLLLPTSIMSALPVSEEASQLRSSLTDTAARVLSVVTAIEFNSSNAGKLPSSLPPSAFHPLSPVASLRVAAPADDAAADSPLIITRQRARFSNNFYRRIELILHELIQTVLQQPDDTTAVVATTVGPTTPASASPVTAKPSSPVQQQAATAVSDAVVRGTVAAVCMQHMCSTNHHLRSFAVSEVMDAVVRISARRGLDDSVGGLTSKALGRNSSTTLPSNANANGGAAAASDSAPADPEEARKLAEQRRARRLAQCFDAMSSIIVPTASHVVSACAEESDAAMERLLHPLHGGSDGEADPSKNVNQHAWSKREELSRYGQLLCDTYVDSLREHLWRVAESNTVKRNVPTPVMSVAVKAFVNLVLRVHERLCGMSRVALSLSQEAEAMDIISGGAGGPGEAAATTAASAGFAKARARLLKAFNAERMSVVLLLRGAIQCILSVAWPSSGVLYQNPLDGGRKPLDSTTTPAAMAPLVFTAIMPFLRPLALLMHLSTLFPALSLQQLCTHHHYARYLTSDDPSTSERYVFHYYRRLSRANIAIDEINTATAEERMEHECWTIFRSCWMMFSYYKFTTEALIVAQSGAGGAAAAVAAAAAGIEGLGRAPVLSVGQCKLFGLIAASAAPLLRMCSSDIQQSMADIAVLMRYSAAGERSHAAVAADVSATSGFAHHHLRKALEHLCGGAAGHWSRLTTGELVLMQSIAELEILRAAAGSVAQLTLYRHFEVREFVASPSIPVALTYIFDTACEHYIRTVGAMLPSVAYQVVRTDLTQLVFLLSFAIASVRESASKLAVRIVDCFPGYAAHASALPLLWCVLDLLDNGTAAQLETFCNYVSFAEVPSVAADPRSVERQQHILFVSSVAEKWASVAQEKAPQALFETAVKFMVIQQQECGERAAAQAGGRQAGSRLAVLASQQQQQNVKREAQNSAATSGAAIKTTAIIRGARAAGRVVTPNYAQSLLLHGRAQGTLQAAGWYASVGQVESTVTAQLRLATRLSRRALITAVTQRLESTLLRPARALFVESGYAVSTALTIGTVAAKEDDEGVMAEVRLARASQATAARERAETATSFAPAVALLILGNGTPSGRRQLLQYLVQGPVQTFRSDILYDAILCWKWLLSQDREAYLLPVLQEVDTALVWTASNRLGLFDGYRVSKNKQVQTGEVPLNTTGGTGNDTAADRDGVYADSEVAASPHKLLLSFLADMYVTEGNPLCLSAEVLRQLYLVAAHIMEFSAIFSLRDEMFGETMRCLLVVGSIARTLRESNMRRLRTGLVALVPFSAIGALRQRWYKALLRWFSKAPPSWYYAKDLVLATEESMVVRSLVQLLREEAALLSRTTLGFLDFSSGVHGGRGSTPAIHHWESLSVVRESIAVVRQAADGGETGLRKIIAKEQARLQGLLRLLLVLVQHEILRLDVWRAPRRTLKLTDTTPSTGWDKLVACADHHNPAVVVAMTFRFSNIEAVRIAASQCITARPERYTNIAEAADLYLTEEVLAAGAPRLFLFRHCTVIQSLRLLDARYAAYKNVTSYAIRSLLSQRSEELIFYLPQLLQLLATDKSGSIQSFLMRMSAKSTMFAHQLLWSLQTEGQGSGALAKKCQLLEKKVKESFTPGQMEFYTNEFDFVGLVTSLSGELMKFEKPQRKPNLRQRLKDDCFHTPPATQHVYLPTDPEYRITGVIPYTAGAMQSAAKCPILVQFTCVKRAFEDLRTPDEIAAAAQEEAQKTGAPPTPPTPVVKACIFKMGDDCRQDQISLQLIGLMQRILCSVGVPSYLYPYRVVTTGQDSGIIECVPHSMSRNEIGKLVESNLAEFFVQTFGHPESVSFRRARENFVKSTAAYSVVSFILNIKDRHNGNIMIDNTGNLVHIDFGFLFDTSPGGDMNFESSPFKLTTEMVQLIGMDVGDASTLHSKSLTRALVDKENYIYFKTLVNRCYLAVRQYAREICVLVELMLHSGLPCFKPKKTIHDLAERLAIDKNEIEAAAFMRRRIHEARQNYRTVLYDFYQKVAEGIEM